LGDRHRRELRHRQGRDFLTPNTMEPMKEHTIVFGSLEDLEHLIEQARFTPSELREACILASINYEMRHIRDVQIDPRVENALRVLDDFTSNRKR